MGMGAEEQIRGYFSFDDADLFANRKGRFSKRQKEKLEKVDQWTNRFLLILALLVLAAAIWRVLVAVKSSGGWTDWIPPVILLVIFGWLFSGTLNKVDGSIEKAEGVVKFVKVESKTGSVTDFESDRIAVHSYEMSVGGIHFANANPALIEYMEGEIYAVYYTNSTRQILSLELISDGK
jgi:hypothetical protein